MLELTPAKPGLLFASFLHRKDLFSTDELVSRWEGAFGASFFYTPVHNPLIPYYSQEMGPEEQLTRFFVVTAQAFQREYLLSTKLLSLEWEREWSAEGKRMVNVDIGLLTAENFLLATTKNYSHRVYIGQNIFADLTYHFHNGRFETFPWTYPDYQDEKKVEFFTWLRSFLLQKLLSV